MSSEFDLAASRDHSFTTIFFKQIWNQSFVFPDQICDSNWSRNYFRVGRIQNPTSNPTCAFATHTRPHGSVWFRDPYSKPWVSTSKSPGGGIWTTPSLKNQLFQCGGTMEAVPHAFENILTRQHTFWEVPKGYDDSDLINFASMFFWWNCDRAMSWIVIWWTFWLLFFQKHDFWKKKFKNMIFVCWDLTRKTTLC